MRATSSSSILSGDGSATSYDAVMARGSLQELIAAGRLAPGQRLVAIHRGTRHSAEVTADGSIRLNGGQSFRSPSAAARGVTGNSVNGWRFWGVERNGQIEPLA